MARNEEKANSLLNRWQALKTEMDFGEGHSRRPFLASECKSLPMAEKWRRELVREIGMLVRKIQNASLGEHIIRDMNDEINKKLRIKQHWERQIVALGGPNYTSRIPSAAELDGKTLPGRRGYKYFGAAKTLPGVRELFEEKDEVKAPKRTRGDMYKHVGPDYYGWRDDEDGVLAAAEAPVEARLRAEAEDEWEQRRRRWDELRRRGAVQAGQEEEAEPEDGDDGLFVGSAAGDASIKAHVSVPDQEKIERAILERKKKELLERYVKAAEEALRQGAEAK